MKITLEQAEKTYNKLLELHGKYEDISLCEAWLPELKLVSKEATLYLNEESLDSDYCPYEEFEPADLNEYKAKKSDFIHWLAEELKKLKTKGGAKCLAFVGNWDEDFGPETVKLVSAKKAIELAKKDGFYDAGLPLSTVYKRMERELTVASSFDLFKTKKNYHYNTPVEKYIGAIPEKTYNSFVECCKEEGINRQTLSAAISRGTTVEKTGYKYRYKKG